MTEELITYTVDGKPRKRRQMLEPTKDELRQQIAAKDARIAYLETPWWRRAWIRARARVVETDKQTAAEQAALERV